MTHYFWYDDQGWWCGDPDGSWSMGPYETFEQVLYRYRAAVEFNEKIVNDTIRAPRLVVSKP